ncbi:hypothetical protein [Pseudomonas vancouverensis]|uniref:Uncharacterized protein n=1 Tax=Pseudomonas vancouverensis TaxID=95300 RepID=A0A1H2NHE3_PSEVA|nr:hypothetical protein [Pseudomonas vancouverensis]KAB0494311.1 hypothetical protein F7R09_21330 [Pseudomonas vancouverensis]TDB60619.1 hypothetical protein EIY72_17435 [Pseudomonas vancouverensis]SDV04236.1 hypothetical protein SAMN05216558_2186 [Pseudomonas vancouverensis]
MKVLNGSYITEGPSSARPLILNQRTTAPESDKSILFQETCLGLTGDQSQIVLRRYFEHYGPDNADWVEYIHAIPTAELVHWIMRHGQLRIECSDNHATLNVPA